MQKAWETIVYERENGFDHRKPAKRVKAVPTTSGSHPNGDVVSSSRCMITLDKETGSIGVNDDTRDTDDIQISIPEDLKIRTESIDETRQKFG